MGRRICGVSELAGDYRPRDLFYKLFRLVNSTLHTLCPFSQNDFRAVGF